MLLRGCSIEINKTVHFVLYFIGLYSRLYSDVAHADITDSNTCLHLDWAICLRNRRSYYFIYLKQMAAMSPAFK